MLTTVQTLLDIIHSCSMEQELQPKEVKSLTVILDKSMTDQIAITAINSGWTAKC
jgi:hypothetical protein